MQQIKLFKGVETEITALQDEVNTWLSSSGARVTQIAGNIAAQTSPRDMHGALGEARYGPSDVLLVVLYESST